MTRIRVLVVQPFFAEDPTKTRLQNSECLSLGYLAAACRAEGIDTDVLDAHLVRLPNETAVEQAARGRYAVVGISCSAQRAYPQAAELARCLKARLPGIHVTAGGQFLSHVHDRVLGLEPAFDSLVRGEGERTLVGLVRRLERGERLAGLPGVSWRDGERVVVNPPAPRIDDLDALPFPARDHMGAILEEALAGVRHVAMLGSRGCVYHCTFCSVDRPRVMRSPAGIVAELRELRERWGVWRFMFNDDLLVGGTPAMLAWADDLAARIARDLPGLELWGMTRADAVTPAIASRLAAAGFRTMFVGVEAASDGVLRRFRKGTRAAMNDRALRVLREAGIRPELGFIMLEPRMAWEDVGDNLRFLRRVGGFSRHNLTNRLNVYHGAPLYAAGVASGEVVPSDDLADRYLYTFDDARVALYSELVDRLKREGFDLKRRVWEVVVRTRELQADAWRALGPAGRDWPPLVRLRAEGRALERLEADRWLEIFEELHRRIEGSAGRDELLRAMPGHARERLADVDREADRMAAQLDETARRLPGAA